MEIAKVRVSGVKAELVKRKESQWEIPAGIIGATIRFAYDDSWAGLTKTVVFDGCGQCKDVVNAGEVVTIPAEVVAKPERKLLVGVYGVDEVCETATPTLWVEGYVRSATDPSGDTSTDPSLPVWAQLEARIRALEKQDVTYTITNSLTNVTTNNPSASVSENAAYSANLTAADGYELDTVTVTMGGVDITETAYVNGKITISAVTGDVVITAVAAEVVAAAFVDVETAYHTGFTLDESGALHSASANWAYTNFIPTVEGQTFQYVGDTSIVSSYPCVCGYDSSGALVEILLGNGSYSQGQEFTIPAGVRCIRGCYYVGDSTAHNLQILESDQDAAGELAFTEGTIVNASGSETARSGGGVTDYIAVSRNAEVTVYNIVPNNGGRIVMYDADKAFVEAVTIYTQGDSTAAVISAAVTNENAAYVRVSTNVLENVTATVSG